MPNAVSKSLSDHLASAGFPFSGSYAYDFGPVFWLRVGKKLAVDVGRSLANAEEVVERTIGKLFDVHCGLPDTALAKNNSTAKICRINFRTLPAMSSGRSNAFG